jgi:hypothetical protein
MGSAPVVKWRRPILWIRELQVAHLFEGSRGVKCCETLLLVLHCCALVGECL